MKLTQLLAKPQLIRIELNDEDTIKEYGEALEFWILDRQPMEKFIQFAQMKPEDFAEMVQAVNSMVLDEQGEVVIKDGLTLPTGVMTKVIGKVIETLGK